LLPGLLRDGDSVAAWILLNLGVSLHKVRTKVLTLLGRSAEALPTSQIVQRATDSGALPQVTRTLIAVDIGNSRVKIGRIARGYEKSSTGSVNELPVPDATLELVISHSTGRFDAARLATWCEDYSRDGAEWYLASVHRGAATKLKATVTNWAMQAGVDCPIRRLAYYDVPLAIRVDEPACVGIDRLLAALAADRIRQRDRAAIIVDLGSAITVDLLDASGAFCGGAILPGIAMSARALEEHTDALPRVALDHLEHPPEPVGKSTVPAIEAGLYWGAVGAIRELVSQMSKDLPAPPEIFLTGGASSHVARLLEANSSYSVRHLPHLVISGIALVNP
jgi:type III pantothenate kinase